MAYYDCLMQKCYDEISETSRLEGSHGLGIAVLEGGLSMLRNSLPRAAHWLSSLKLHGRRLLHTNSGDRFRNTPCATQHIKNRGVWLKAFVQENSKLQTKDWWEAGLLDQRLFETGYVLPATMEQRKQGIVARIYGPKLFLLLASFYPIVAFPHLDEDAVFSKSSRMFILAVSILLAGLYCYPHDQGVSTNAKSNHGL